MNNSLEQAFRYSHIGLTMAIIGGGCVFAGIKADDYFSIAPWGMFLGLGFGMIAGFSYFFLEISRIIGEMKTEETESE